jgi:hypothetical protein
LLERLIQVQRFQRPQMAEETATHPIRRERVVVAGLAVVVDRATRTAEAVAVLFTSTIIQLLLVQTFS